MGSPAFTSMVLAWKAARLVALAWVAASFTASLMAREVKVAPETESTPVPLAALMSSKRMS